jgi:5-hydroxyisourate hydrolase
LESRKQNASWTSVGKGTTDKDGRVANLAAGEEVHGGTYRLTFDTGAYLSKGKNTFFPEVSIVFYVDDASQNYHIPLLLSPYGYSTYRGS